MSIFNIILPVFVIILAGYFFARTGLAQQTWVHTLNGFVYYVSLPAIIIYSFWNLDFTSPGILRVSLISFVSLVLYAGILAAILLLFKFSGKLKAAIFLTAVVGNTVYMGFPLSQSVFGKEDYSLAICAATIQLVLGLILGAMATEFWAIKSRKFLIYIKDLFFNPLFIALCLGIILSLLNFHNSEINSVKNALNMLGLTASPLALFALGAFMHKRWENHHEAVSIITAVVKVLIFPIILLALGLWLFSSSQISSIRVNSFLGAMPTAVTAFVIAERFGLEEKFVANVIILSTTLSVVTISFFIYLLNY